MGLLACSSAKSEFLVDHLFFSLLLNLVYQTLSYRNSRLYGIGWPTISVSSTVRPSLHEISVISVTARDNYSCTFNLIVLLRKYSERQKILWQSDHSLLHLIGDIVQGMLKCPSIDLLVQIHLAQKDKITKNSTAIFIPSENMSLLHSKEYQLLLIYLCQFFSKKALTS